MVLGILGAHLLTVTILARSLLGSITVLKCVCLWALIGKHRLEPQGHSINGAILVFLFNILAYNISWLIITISQVLGSVIEWRTCHLCFIIFYYISSFLFVQVFKLWSVGEFPQRKTSGYPGSLLV